MSAIKQVDHVPSDLICDDPTPIGDKLLIAPVGRSVHRMGCVLHPPLHPTLTNILPQSIFFHADL